MNGLFLHCRPGFEAECAAEIQQCAAERGIEGYCRAKLDAAYVVFQAHEEGAAARLHAELAFGELVFARQWFVVRSLSKDLPETDRVSALLAGLDGVPEPPRELFLETPDTNEGKELSGLCRALQRPMEIAARIGKTAPPEREGLRLHCCFLSGTAAYAGYAARRNSAPWPMGIPRLRFPRAAPSRSALKLEEAFLCLLTPEEREALLRPGLRAVDLGAAPGGWTWQLAHRHLRVIAVDNGAMDAELMESGLVEHVRSDGFRYRPSEPVDWMVCDIVEQPIRVAELAARWFVEGLCRHSIFNLKLPMKKRYQETRRCLALIHEKLTNASLDYRLACKQLYHDREEVTVCLRRLS